MILNDRLTIRNMIENGRRFVPINTFMGIEHSFEAKYTSKNNTEKRCTFLKQRFAQIFWIIRERTKNALIRASIEERKGFSLVYVFFLSVSVSVSLCSDGDV